MKYLSLFLLIILFSCSSPKEQYRASIDLQGEWQFALDTSNIGIEQKWFLSDLNDTIHLPGTTDSNQKGFLNHDTTTLHLNRLYTYEGPAWYRTKIVIPESFRDKHIELFLERTRSSTTWIDSVQVGSSHLLQSAQQFDVTDLLSPGEHTISIRIDNDRKLTPYGDVHIYSDHTQTNWNGILGDLHIEASSKTYISNLQVYPDISKQQIGIELEVENPLHIDSLNIELRIEKTIDGRTTTLRSQQTNIAWQPKIKLEYAFDEKISLWDEYERPLYHLTAVISDGQHKDAKSVSFGMRKFSVKGTQFAINDHITFLRGKHDGAVFPLTGYAPMQIDDWIRVFRIAKSWGINHYRFHSWCPPEAAFTAADEEGIYIQAELPFWGGLESDTVAQMLKEEGLAMLKAYGNHPSFVMFSPGNELWGGHDKVEKNMLVFKAYDNRHLYTMGSNNNIGYLPPAAYADFFVGARIPDHGDSTLGHTRLTHAFADSWQGAILNTRTPSTEVNFDYAVNHLSIPVISHEVGQYQVFPDYKEIDKYTGVLRPWNLEVFRNGLEKAGMVDLDSAFHKASGAWAALCYKAEMEAALRTKGLAGFQLLDLQDYPGQGTALVGMLDAFMDSKNVVTPEEWKRSCNDVVLLLEFPKYCWSNSESFKAKLAIANYSSKTINNTVKWEIKKQDGSMEASGSFNAVKISNGGLSEVGAIINDLSSINNAEKLIVSISIDGTDYSNSYPIWVYPSKLKVETSADIVVAKRVNNEMIAQLENGAKVLLFPQTEDVAVKSFPGLFPPDFWNYGMFKSISEHVNKPVSPGTLGLLMDPDHPLFNSFPTDFHSNWQWFSIIKVSNSFVLDSIPDNYKPIVQVIDNLERDHKLGLIFEFKVGKGKLLVCMSQLDRIMDKPEAAQLYRSIINYMETGKFSPLYELSAEKLRGLFNSR